MKIDPRTPKACIAPSHGSQATQEYIEDVMVIDWTFSRESLLFRFTLLSPSMLCFAIRL